jgi:hypothetical protein
VPKAFSRRTLGVFEDASASIPIRQLDRAFENAGIRPGKDPGGPDGARRAQFRRYIAAADQGDPQHVNRLADALGALIEEVATSKQEFLVKAAERDGFLFADGVFTPANTAPTSFAVTSVEDLGAIEDRGRRLHLLANDNPSDAIAGAKELLESVCRSVLRVLGEPSPAKKADLVVIATLTLKALDIVRPGIDDTKTAAALIRGFREQLSAAGARPRHARLAVGAAVTFTAFVAETYAEGPRLPLEAGRANAGD